MTKDALRAAADGGTSRREFLGELSLALAGSVLPVARAGAAAPTGPERSGAGPGAPPPANGPMPSDVRRYGVLPNRSDAAAANTARLSDLVKPAGAFTGKLVFPNTTGKDVYYFNDTIPFHDGVHIDLMNSTLNFSKSGVARDTNAGFFHAIRDFSIENGAIAVDYTHNKGSNTGNALSFGGRADDCVLFPNLYDSMLASSMGKITVRNLRISSNAGGGEGRGILMLGGLDGVLLENVTIDGQGKLIHGVYYEFGWATNEEKRYLRQTSHAHNFRVKNLAVTGVIDEGFTANGMYGAVIDGLEVTNAGGVCAFGPGESLFFRPWSGVGDRNLKPNIIIRNVIGESIANVGVGVTGASKISGGFLDNGTVHDNPNGLAAAQETDLIDFTLDTFSIAGTSNNYGVYSSARRAVIRNGVLKGFQRGVVTTQECTRFIIDAVHVLDSTGLGIQIGQAQSLHNPPRPSTGLVRDCVVAGSGASGASAAVALATTQTCVVDACRFGYDQEHDNKPELTQTQAVTASADALGVICRGNYVGGSADRAAAYVLMPGQSGARQCRLVGNGGITSARGNWLMGEPGEALQRVTDNGTITTAGNSSVWVTAPASASGVGLQAGSQHGQAVIVIHDGPAASSIRFGGAGSSNVADGAQPLAGLASRMFIWNEAEKVWHPFD